jgi:hypothetical protein
VSADGIQIPPPTLPCAHTYQWPQQHRRRARLPARRQFPPSPPRLRTCLTSQVAARNRSSARFPRGPCLRCIAWTTFCKLARRGGTCKESPRSARCAANPARRAQIAKEHFPLKRLQDLRRAAAILTKARAEEGNAASSREQDTAAMFGIGDSVLALNREQDEEGRWFEAKILRIEKSTPQYFVHFVAWSTAHDKWVPGKYVRPLRGKWAQRPSAATFRQGRNDESAAGVGGGGAEFETKARLAALMQHARNEAEQRDGHAQTMRPFMSGPQHQLGLRLKRNPTTDAIARAWDQSQALVKRSRLLEGSAESSPGTVAGMTADRIRDIVAEPDFAQLLAKVEQDLQAHSDPDLIHALSSKRLEDLVRFLAMGGGEAGR